MCLYRNINQNFKIAFSTLTNGHRHFIGKVQFLELVASEEFNYSPELLRQSGVSEKVIIFINKKLSKAIASGEQIYVFACRNLLFYLYSI